MINLLPSDRKNLLRQALRVRLALILASSFAVSLLSFCLLLLALHFYVAGKVRAAELSLASFESEVVQLREAERRLRTANAELEEVMDHYRGQEGAVLVLERLTEHLPPSMSLRGFGFLIGRDKKSGKRQDPAITVTGYASSREALLAFRRRLLEDPIFQDVVFPPSNWVEPYDVSFSMSARIHEEP